MKLSFNLRGVAQKSVNRVDSHRPIINNEQVEGVTLDVELSPEELCSVLSNSL